VPWLRKLDAANFRWNRRKERMKKEQLNQVLHSELQEDQNEDQCFSPSFIFIAGADTQVTQRSNC
jgi:hypothetical protein